MIFETLTGLFLPPTSIKSHEKAWPGNPAGVGEGDAPRVALPEGRSDGDTLPALGEGVMVEGCGEEGGISSSIFVMVWTISCSCAGVFSSMTIYRC